MLEANGPVNSCAGGRHGFGRTNVFHIGKKEKPLWMSQQYVADFNNCCFGSKNEPQVLKCSSSGLLSSCQ